MSRAARLLDIIQLLRGARTPLRAADLADSLEVHPRTVYRDIAALKARRVPIDGAAGLGYVLRPGYELPPLVFTPDEMEAIVVGAKLIRRTGDTSLQKAAQSVVLKVKAVTSGNVVRHPTEDAFFVSEFGAPRSNNIDMGKIRRAIRDRKKIHISYVDEHESRSERTVQPVGVAYYIEVTLIHAWCELREDYRHFRTDRILGARFLKQGFQARSGGPTN
jgi:predicted DNA-binding transcriptional regulator YafY